MVIEHFAQFFVAKGRHPDTWPVVFEDLIPYREHTKQNVH